MKRILILGGSGFIGNALYKELQPYYDTYGTYYSHKKFKHNKHFYHFDHTQEDVNEVLKKVQPKLIISAIRGPFEDQIDMHQQLIEHVRLFDCRLLFLSSSNVFDAFYHYPSYESDKTLSESIYGRLKIKIENDIMRLPTSKYVIARLPMVFGRHCPRIKEIEEKINAKEAIEVFPNTIVNLISDRKLTQQIHYIINQNLTGIFHLGTTDLITHYDFHKRLAAKRNWHKILFKQVYTTNDMRYIAVLPKDNKLPSHLLPNCEAVLEDSYLSVSEE